jgi:hypothetical protein
LRITEIALSQNAKIIIRLKKSVICLG